MGSRRPKKARAVTKRRSRAVTKGRGGDAARKDDAKAIAARRARKKVAIARSIDAANHEARTALQPAVQAGYTIQAFNKSRGELAPYSVMEGLLDAEEALLNGKMHRAETMLLAQAHTLDAIFNRLAGRAGANMDVNRPAMEQDLRLALKAQAQARTTLETLAVMKNPPAVTFMRQANFAAGPQQVNNAAGSSEHIAGAREIPGGTNRLLEVFGGQRVDERASSTPGKADQRVAAVGEVLGPAVGEGEVRVKPKRR